MTLFLRLAVVCLVVWNVTAAATPRALDANGNVSFEDLYFQVPQGFTLLQDAKSDNTMFLTFTRGEDSLMVYVNPDIAVDMKAIFGHGSQIVQDVSEQAYGPVAWQTLQVVHKAEASSVYLKAFMNKIHGKVYYGYARSASAQIASEIVDSFLKNLIIHVNRGQGRSLTGVDYTGKKYYFGWGAAGHGDPSMMHNEVKYDVMHTHDIFTKEIGGSYIGSKLIGPSTSGSQIKAEWSRLASLMTAEDMYIQYSSGHGSTSGLGVGVTYNQIRDNALAYPAKEVIIFIMACHSGGLVEAFDAKKAEWENWPSQGRTLMVMASSKKSQTSSTGPGTDSDEAGGPNGSAGSAFGHALWKALIGYADGHVDGVKDGFLSLGEIRDYSIMKTKQVGGHTPVATGAYSTALVMNKKPSKEFLERLVGGTEDLSDAQIERAIRELDAAMRIN